MERRAVFEMWAIILCSALITGMLILLRSREPERQARRAEMQAARQLEQGAALFQEHCRSCHGVLGEGVGELGPALNDAAFFTTRLEEVHWLGTLEEYILQTISLGRMTATRPLYAGDGAMAMTPFLQAQSGPLRPDEVRALAAFVQNWEASALGEFTYQQVELPTPEIGDVTEQAARGREIFTRSGCAGCHTVSGLSDNATGPALSAIGTEAATRLPGYSADAYLRESFLIPNGYRLPGYETATACGGVLSQAQLDDLVVFLLSLR